MSIRLCDENYENINKYLTKILYDYHDSTHTQYIIVTYMSIKERRNHRSEIDDETWSI